MPQSTVPQDVVDKDHELDARAGKATESLAKHRWHSTLDPDGPQHGIRAYARAVGRNEATISRHVNGYAMYVARSTGVAPGATLSLEDSFRLAGQSAEQQEFSEAIAQGSGKPVSQVARGDHAHQRNAIIERARQRETRRGGSAVEHARNIAAEERQVAEARRQRAVEEKQRHSLMFIHIEGELANAQRRMMNALHEAAGVDLTDEEMELIRASIANIRAVLNLIDARMAGNPDIDWDAELQKLGGNA